jgi:hypothetical protein
VSIVVPPMNGSQPAAGETQVGQQLIDASMQTALSMVQKMRMLDSGAEAKDFAAAVLNLSQVIALLDPTRDEKGVPLDHQLETAEAEGAAGAGEGQGAVEGVGADADEDGDG